CNKARCASVVSYCLIQDKCGCDATINCSCCADCARCLDQHYRHCCDCVGMRRGRNYTTIVPPIMTSTVAIFDKPEPRLFVALTESSVPALRCSIVRFPVSQELAAHGSRELYHRRHHGKPPEVAQDIEHTATKDPICVVMYFDECMSLNDCRMNCESTGSTSYRWFHNGCCECVGPDCLNHGHMEAKCSNCLH
uniref:Uncharacterized protein n=1 Tax=Ciona savignyi TaxID=51511 RepID=H2Y5W7_CIOSA